MRKIINILLNQLIVLSLSTNAYGTEVSCSTVEDRLLSGFHELCSATDNADYLNAFNDRQDIVEKLKWQFMGCADDGYFDGEEIDHVEVFVTSEFIISDVKALNEVVKESSSGNEGKGAVSSRLKNYLLSNIEESCKRFRKAVDGIE